MRVLGVIRKCACHVRRTERGVMYHLHYDSILRDFSDTFDDVFLALNIVFRIFKSY